MRTLKSIKEFETYMNSPHNKQVWIKTSTNMGKLSIKKSFKAAIYLGTAFHFKEKKQYEKMFRHLQKSVAMGNMNALKYLSDVFSDGLGCKRDDEYAIKLLRFAAKRKNIKSMIKLSKLELVEGGICVAKQLLDDANLLDKNKKFIKEINNFLCQCFEFLFACNDCNSCHRNTKEAIKYASMAAENGDADAMHRLSVLLDPENYLSDKDLANKDKSIYWLIKSAENGDEGSIDGVFWEADFESDMNRKICLYNWIHEQAKNGHMSSVKKWGELCWNNCDYEESIKWLRLAISNGYKTSFNSWKDEAIEDMLKFSHSENFGFYLQYVEKDEIQEFLENLVENKEKKNRMQTICRLFIDYGLDWRKVIRDDGIILMIKQNEVLQKVCAKVEFHLVKLGIDTVKIVLDYLPWFKILQEMNPKKRKFI